MIPDAIDDIREEECKTFMAEFDRGEHPLSAEDEAALKRAEQELMRKLRLILK